MPLITPQQKTFFDLFGYLKLPGLFAGEINVIRHQLEAAFREHAAQSYDWRHVVHDNLPRQILPMVTEKSADLKAVSEDARVREIVESLIGKGYQLIGSDGNIYNCGTRWHTDIVGLPYNCRNVKLIFYFDPMRAGEDAFRVIPGSQFHTSPFAKQLKETIKTPRDTLGIDVAEVPSVEVPTEPGDLVIFDARAWHAVPYCGNTRLMMSFLFADEHYVAPEQKDPDYR